MNETANTHCHAAHSNNSSKPYKSVHPGTLVPTASTFAPVPNYGGERLSLPMVGHAKKGFTSGKVCHDPQMRRALFGELSRASAAQRAS